VGRRQLAQAWEDPLLQGVTLGFQIAEGRADKDAESTGEKRHITCLT
jgi:hypothetical protein